MAVELIKSSWNNLWANVKDLTCEFCFDMMGIEVKLEEGNDSRDKGCVKKRVENTKRKSFKGKQAKEMVWMFVEFIFLVAIG